MARALDWNLRLEVMLSSPIVLHVLRPYATEEEYLASERASIDSRTMLLIDQPPLPAETFIVFDVQLQNGEKPIRAEARVIGHSLATATEPGGLRVRFKRFGAKTKAFIDRASAGSRADSAGQEWSSAASSCCAPSIAPESTRVGAAEVEPARDSSAEAASPEERRHPSGVHRVRGPVPAPTNREELLERLRRRATALGVDSHRLVSR